MAHEAVAIARQPGTAATVRALAASHTFTRTRIAGSAWSRRSSSALARRASDTGATLPAGGPTGERVQQKIDRALELLERRVLDPRGPDRLVQPGVDVAVRAPVATAEVGHEPVALVAQDGAALEVRHGRRGRVVLLDRGGRRGERGSRGGRGRGRATEQRHLRRRR